MKPDCWVCKECWMIESNFVPLEHLSCNAEDIGQICIGTLTPMYSRESLVNWLQERKKKTWRYYNDPESKVIPNESMYATLGAFDAVIAELTAGEDKE